jgi:hypothetical protein
MHVMGILYVKMGGCVTFLEEADWYVGRLGIRDQGSGESGKQGSWRGRRR